MLICWAFMRPGRVELPPLFPGTRPSTLRVYQFRHSRVGQPILEAGRERRKFLASVRRGVYHAEHVFPGKLEAARPHGGLSWI
jgi:hypothetical protein